MRMTYRRRVINPTAFLPSFSSYCRCRFRVSWGFHPIRCRRRFSMAIPDTDVDLLAVTESGHAAGHETVSIDPSPGRYKRWDNPIKISSHTVSKEE